MRRTIIGLASTLFCCLGCLHAPMPWSPDGTWIAYTVEVRPPGPILNPGWIYRPGRSDEKDSRPPSSGYRLWATRPTTNTSVLLEESVGPITAPGWSPDGHKLAFGRLVMEPDRSSRFEVVILEGLARRRVLWNRPVAALDAEASRIAFQAIVWSPDGRYLAVPQLEPAGLAILRTDNGRVVNTIPDAFLPSWSPTGGRLAFYLRSGSQSLSYLDSALGQPRHLHDVGQASQAPCWSRDGTSIYTVTRRTSATIRDGMSDQIDVVRIRLETAAVETIRSLSGDLGGKRDRVIEGSSVTFDRDAENLFTSTVVEGQAHQVSWFRPAQNEVVKRFVVIDQSIPVGSLSLSPDGHTLAGRVGVADQLSPPVVCDTESGDFKVWLIAPDDRARLDWIATLIRTARSLLGTLPPPTIRQGDNPPTVLERPTILPLVTELPRNSDALIRLKRIGRLGRPLCDRPVEAPEPDPATRQVLDEARLFFDALREDFPAALLDLEPLEAAAATPERRLALLTVRAQLLLNLEHFTAARRVIAFLDAVDRPSARRVEWAGQRYELTDEPHPGQGWPRYLAESLAKLQNAQNEAKPTGRRFDHRPSRLDFLLRPLPPFRVNPLLPPGANPPEIPRRPNAPRAPGPRNFAPPR